MTDEKAPHRRLPERPSRDHLRKAAKRLARKDGIKLTRAQFQLARSYGFRSWVALMRAVDARAEPAKSPLSAAAARGDLTAVVALLAEGAPVESEPREVNSPLFLACAGEAPDQARLVVAAALIEAGAHVRRGCEGGATPLHAAARRGPAALVEQLMRAGALFWQTDARGRRPYDYARAGTPTDRDRILYLLADGPKIGDSLFREAVDCIHAGDVARLARLLDAHPRLLRERAVEPDIAPRGYFSDPKLFWFVANNPTLVPRPAPNIVEVAETMIARGVDQADLDYTLGLVMTDSVMPRDLQIELVRTLDAAGAIADRQAILMTLGHRQTAPVRWLLDHGRPLDAAIAAGLGMTDRLPALLERSQPEERADALAMAVINGEAETARLCLVAGADANRFMPCHSHSTPLHQAAIDGEVAMLELLIEHGAKLDTRDTLWNGTPLGWAIHGGKAEAQSYLQRCDSPI